MRDIEHYAVRSLVIQVDVCICQHRRVTKAEVNDIREPRPKEARKFSQVDAKTPLTLGIIHNHIQNEEEGSS